MIATPPSASGFRINPIAAGIGVDGVTIAHKRAMEYGRQVFGEQRSDRHQTGADRGSEDFEDRPDHHVCVGPCYVVRFGRVSRMHLKHLHVASRDWIE
jgi:hypothetical protein